LDGTDVARKRLNPNVVADWIGIANAAERALQTGTGTDRAAALWDVAQERGTTEQHVRRLVHGWRFIQSVRADDRELAECLERSSYNVTDVISRWHPRDRHAASEAAKQYHAGNLTLAQIRAGYESSQHHGRSKVSAPPTPDYLDAVRGKIEDIEPWIRGLQSTPRSLPPFGKFDLSFRGEGDRELGVVVLPPRLGTNDQKARFASDAGLILLAHQMGIATIIAGPKGSVLDGYTNWIAEIGIDDCHVIELERVMREVWT
jgi:hypothetical protein